MAHHRRANAPDGEAGDVDDNNVAATAPAGAKAKSKKKKSKHKRRHASPDDDNDAKRRRRETARQTADAISAAYLQYPDIKRLKEPHSHCKETLKNIIESVALNEQYFNQLGAFWKASVDDRTVPLPLHNKQHANAFMLQERRQEFQRTYARSKCRNKSIRRARGRAKNSCISCCTKHAQCSFAHCA